MEEEKEKEKNLKFFKLEKTRNLERI